MTATRDLEGKTILITGATSGVGLVSARVLGGRGAHVVLAVRNPKKAEPVKAELDAAGGSSEILEVDLSNLSSVRAAGERYAATDRPLDVLLNNAGIAGTRGLTPDGFEVAFGTNHLGPFLLTEKLLPLVRKAPQGRIVNVSSVGHYRVRAIEWDALRRPTAHRTGLHEYQVSKLCNVLHAKELARRLAGTKVTTYSLHPGVVATDVWRNVPWPFGWAMKQFMITPEEGARTQLRCASDPSLASETGLYYDKSRPKEPSALSKDEALAKELWVRSEEWVRAFL